MDGLPEVRGRRVSLFRQGYDTAGSREMARVFRELARREAMAALAVIEGALLIGLPRPCFASGGTGLPNLARWLGSGGFKHHPNSGRARPRISPNLNKQTSWDASRAGREKLQDFPAISLHIDDF